MEDTNLLYTSGDIEETARLDEMWRNAPNIDLKFVQEGSLLKGKAVLPYISTKDGLRIVGLDNIRKWFQREKAKQLQAA